MTRLLDTLPARVLSWPTPNLNSASFGWKTERAKSSSPTRPPPPPLRAIGLPQPTIPVVRSLPSTSSMSATTSSPFAGTNRPLRLLFQTRSSPRPARNISKPSDSSRDEPISPTANPYEPLRLVSGFDPRPILGLGLCARHHYRTLL